MTLRSKARVLARPAVVRCVVGIAGAVVLLLGVIKAWGASDRTLLAAIGAALLVGAWVGHDVVRVVVHMGSHRVELERRALAAEAHAQIAETKVTEAAAALEEVAGARGVPAPVKAAAATGLDKLRSIPITSTFSLMNAAMYKARGNGKYDLMLFSRPPGMRLGCTVVAPTGESWSWSEPDGPSAVATLVRGMAVMLRFPQDFPSAPPATERGQWLWRWTVSDAGSTASASRVLNTGGFVVA